MTKSVAAQLEREIRQVADNLKAPVSNLVTNSVQSSLEVLGTVTAGVGQIIGACVDEGIRVGERIRRGLDVASK